MTKNSVNARFHRLRSLSISGGFLDGLSLEFNQGLNCVIGARGSGKTTILELVRYALDRMPAKSDAKKRLQSIINQNLKGGAVRLNIETKDGLSYTVTRSPDEEPILLDSKGQPTDISVATSGLFSADIFSQNEVEDMADNPTDQLRLIDSFEADAMREVESQAGQLQRKLATNAQECMDLHKRQSGLSDEISTLPGIEEKLRSFASQPGGNASEINDAYTKKSLRDRERRAVEAVSKEAGAQNDELGTQSSKLQQRLRPFFDREVLEGPNSAVLRELADSIKEGGREVDAYLQQSRLRLQEILKKAAQLEMTLANAHRTQEMEFQSLLARHKEIQSQSGDRVALEKRRNDLLEKQRLFNDAQERLQRLTEKRSTLLSELQVLRSKRFELRRAVAERINKELLPAIRVRIEQLGNHEPYLKSLENSLKNTGMKFSVVAQKIVSRLTPLDFVTIVRNQDEAGLINRAELNVEQARKVMGAMQESSATYDIETIDLPDRPCIELLVGGEYKDSLLLSTGQKCTAILPILLLDSANPLLIDQPEDNLDNRYIYTVVVAQLRDVKQRRQLILNTHNPNIPVLAEASHIVVLKSEGQQSKLDKQGTVDACKSDIVMLLEGGEEAFRERRRRYSF